MYKKIISILLIMLLVISNFNLVKTNASVDGNGSESVGDTSEDFGISDEHYQDWELTWSDEFNGKGDNLSENGVNLDNWGFQTGTGTQYGLTDWGNAEEQYYQEENASVEDGKLVIEAAKETVDGKPYTSARLFTKDTLNKKYGKFEARMKLPEGDGLWPAFWMMPTNEEYGTWAASGELDIMEARGRILDEIGGTIHYGKNWPNNSYSGGAHHFEDGDSITNFHVYSVEWEPGEIRWYVDGELYHTETNWNSIGQDQPAKYSFPAPFDQEFYMILNLAIGGNYDGGRVPDDSDLPAKMEVDYVRVYDLTGREYKQPVEPVLEKEPLPQDQKEPTPDGNLIHDNNFQKDITEITTDTEVLNKDYWNFAYINTFGGSASISTDTLNDETFAKIDITTPGAQTHSVQLIQYLTLGTARHYKVSFDAKSDTNRDINVKLGAGAERGYVAYSGNESFSLTDETQPYEFTFQMEDKSDPLARIEFNMGTIGNPVWIGNVRVEEIQVDNNDPYNENGPKEPLSNGNHVYNGTFDIGNMDRMTYWNLSSDDANASASVDPAVREVAVDITDGGTSSDAIKLVQTGINLLPNDAYKLTFDARAAEGRDIEVAVLSKEGDVNYLANQTVSLATTMEANEMTFVMPDVEDLEGQLVFLLGGNTRNVVIDNVRMIRTTDNNAGVSLEEAFPLKNGDFSNELGSWTEHYQGQYDGTSKASFAEEDSKAKMTVENTGANPWDISLSQEGLALKEGLTYVVKFDARTSIDRKIELVADNGAPSYSRYLSEIVELTTDLQTFTYEFEMPATEDMGLKFLVGAVDGTVIEDAHDIFIDNVRLEVKGEREKYFPLSNGDFLNGLESWTEHYQGQYEGTSKAMFTEEDSKAKISVENTGANPWDISLSQEGLTLEEGLTYVVEFDAKASINRKIEIVADNGAPSYSRHLSEIVELTTDLQTFTYEFEMPATEDMGLKFLVGKVDGIEDAHDIFIDNVKLEVKGARDVLSGSQGGEQPEEPTEPEEPVDPSDKEWKEIGENLIVDGSFDTTTEFGNPENLLTWNIFNQSDHEDWAGQADFSVIDGVVNAQINQVGWYWWQIQLSQDMTVPSGTYKIAFDMQSDHDRLVSLELVDSGAAIQQFNVNNTMKTYEAIIEVDETGDYSFMLGLGREDGAPELTTPYTMLIDNVRLVEVEEVEVTNPTEPGDQDGDEPEDQNDEETVVPVEKNTEIPVEKNNRVNLSNSKASIKMPANLPANTTVSIDLVEDIVNTPQGHGKAGEVIDVTLNLEEEFEGEFELTLGYEEGFENIAIYYYNETTEEWELIDGDIDPETNTITATVTHFSTYGVLGMPSEDSEDPNDEESVTDEPGTKNPETDDTDEPGDQDGEEPTTDESGAVDPETDEDIDEPTSEDAETDENKELPDTATSMFNLLLIGFLITILGLALFLLQRRKRETTE